MRVGAIRRGRALRSVDDVRGRADFGTLTARADIADTSNPVVVDVTAELERRLGITTPGSYHGIFVTCGTP